MRLMDAKYDKTLNNEELFTKAQDGCEYSKELLFKNNIPLIRRLANKWAKTNWVEDYEDLMSLGYFAFVNTYNYFDMSKNMKFNTLLGIAVWREFLRVEKRNKRSNRSKYMAVSMDTYKIDEDDVPSLHETIGNEKEIDVINNMSNLQVTKTVELFIDTQFTKREKYVFDQHFNNHRKLEDISNELGVSRQAVHQSYKKGMNKLLNCDLMFA